MTKNSVPVQIFIRGKAVEFDSAVLAHDVSIFINGIAGYQRELAFLKDEEIKTVFITLQSRKSYVGMLVQVLAKRNSHVKVWAGGRGFKNHTRSAYFDLKSDTQRVIRNLWRAVATRVFNLTNCDSDVLEEFPGCENTFIEHSLEKTE